ncbi:MAG TPA: biotin/lipoyl-binding protein [Myxococcales bacterium]
MSDPGANGGEGAMFREAALRRLLHRSSEGDVLRISPSWVDRIFWILLATVATALIYSSLATVSEYAAGPAVVRLEDRIDLPAAVDGLVAAVLVQPGQHVEAGEVLLQLDEAAQRSELAAADHEYELELLARLRDPALPAATAFSAIRARQELAQSRLFERAVRAPVPGIVRDIRRRRGERVNRGDLMLSLARADAGFSVVAVLPGEQRPLLRPGLPMRIEMPGFRHASQTVRIDALGDEIVGPAEVRRFLGEEVGDALPVSGARVLVSAPLPSRQFESDGRRFDVYDGMQVRAEVRVRSSTALSLFMPAWKGILGGDR